MRTLLSRANLNTRRKRKREYTLSIKGNNDTTQSKCAMCSQNRSSCNHGYGEARGRHPLVSKKVSQMKSGTGIGVA